MQVNCRQRPDQANYMPVFKADFGWYSSAMNTLDQQLHSGPGAPGS